MGSQAFRTLPAGVLDLTTLLCAFINGDTNRTLTTWDEFEDGHKSVRLVDFREHLTSDTRASNLLRFDITESMKYITRDLYYSPIALFRDTSGP